MKHILKTLSVFLVFAMLISLFSACGGDEKDTDAESINGTATETGKETEKMAEKETEKITETETETEAKTEPEKKSIRILEIGNSFGWDAVANLYPILKSMGYEDIYIRAVHYSACTIQQYAQYAKRDKAVFYDYVIDNEKPLTCKENAVLKDIIASEEWDVISIMNHSNHAGLENKYTDGNIEFMIEFIEEHSPNKDYKLFWYMPWAYSTTYRDNDYKLYNNDQMTMYNAITDCVEKYIVPNEAFDGIIPAGTVVQNLRTSMFKNHLERDNFHLSLVVARYAASLHYACVVTGKTVEDCSYFPTESASGLNKKTVPALWEAVTNAINTPFDVTESTYK
ncbi:MAG: DUF4886 domain-containing protein [Ruminococcaceae bacterium]|nr:DUF4886 domain-containing protein [Oscillospiraceae bacterium]